MALISLENSTQWQLKRCVVIEMIPQPMTEHATRGRREWKEGMCGNCNALFA
jgi:hypothetical protein